MVEALHGRGGGGRGPEAIDQSTPTSKGPSATSSGCETMGDVVGRLAGANGKATLSRIKVPFAETKSCHDQGLNGLPLRRDAAYGLAPCL